MEIIIIGAGIGGLSASLSLSQSGHKITILESVQTLAEIGAGVQMTPNATKYFWKWGLGPDILENAALPTSFNVRRSTNGEFLGQVPFEGFEEKYGAPYIVIHRADIHRILHEHAMKDGVNLRLDCKVVKYDFENGSVELGNGETLQADLVVAVDGINSFARKSFLADETGDGLEKTGWAAYRTIAPVDAIKANPETANLVKEHNCNCWVGDGRLVMTYMVKNSKILNIVLSHRDDVDTTEWSTEQYREEIEKLYGEWDPVLRALLSITDSTDSNIQNWPIYQVKPLRKWTSESGKFVLMGDAAHAMAFYLSMGVSMAVEDAEVLTECISRQQATNCSLEKAMGVFEKVRKRRAEAMKEASLHAGNILQLPPGPQQEVRDSALKDDGASAGKSEDEDFYVTRTSYGIADQKIRDWCYGYDVIEEVNAAW